MRKWKRWLYENFLPAWCREDLLGENARLTSKVQAQSREIVRLTAYIDGMLAATRRQPRITIHAREVNRYERTDRPV